MNANQFREAAHATVEDVISYLSSLSTRRVNPSVEPGYLHPQLPATAPESPEPWRSILSDIPSKIIPGLMHWQSPNFMAFFPSTISYPSLLAELYSAAFTAPAFNWVCSPACTELETVVLDWVAKMLGLPDVFLSPGDARGGGKGRGKGGGVIQGSASEAIVVCIVAARERHVRAVLEKEGLLPASAEDSEERIRKREDKAIEVRGRLVAMGSEMSHSATQKAANILGLRYRAVHAGAESDYAMTAEAVRLKLVEAEESGLIPFYLTATVGTTATCAVDDLEGIARLKAERPDLWVHVDAAYAGAALVCPEMRPQAKSQWFGHFDSFEVNMHKWLLVNFDAACLYVQNSADLISALTISPSYLQNLDSLTGLVTDYRNWQIPLGRRFRSLKIWFVLRSYGISGLQKMVREHVRVGEVFAALCKSDRGKAAGIEVVTGSSFALTVFRIRERVSEPTDRTGGAVVADGNGKRNPPDDMNAFGTQSPTPADNALTKRVYETINGQGEIFLTSSVIGGEYCIRLVSANENASEKNVRRAFDIIVDIIGEVKDSTTKKVDGSEFAPT